MWDARIRLRSARFSNRQCQRHSESDRDPASAGGREECERSGDDFVAAADVERAKREDQRIRAVRTTDRISSSGQLGHLLLELSNGRPEYERLIFDHTHDGIRDFVADCRMLGPEV